MGSEQKSQHLHFFAMFTNPDIIKLIHGSLHYFKFICQDACFKVAFVACLHTETCAREVGTANIDLLTIKNNHLEMNTQTKYSSQAVIGNYILAKVSLKFGPDSLA